MDLIHALMLVGGLALAAHTTWQHLGRSPAARRWTRTVQGDLTRRSVLVVRPLLSVVLVLGALTAFTEGSTGANVAVAGPIAIALVVLLAYLVLPLPVPRVVQPRWYRHA
ncbi:hypothetical protein [Nocardioides sp. cx-173]|uniref:hypothetical protein n=1 Tax=Nocardioides sp. cx-173 TaxID=2898796 RepID=UPI001E3F4B9B|nr:hypothetical protein [Nocardioides sp. cx-173]MCD4525273.1 hypothetical protein [Nocardioides sp. cx-173]UGB40925.1 hypothetical protein LQ940_16300 [Nocardioides sp. cx-173]